MKNILLLILSGFSLTCFAQFSSYEESKEDILFMFDVNYIKQSNPKVSDKFVLSARDDYETRVLMGPFENLKPVLKEAFEAADCENCEQVSETLTKNPINYIFDIIEYQDVFLVTVFEDQYKVIRYQPLKKD